MPVTRPNVLVLGAGPHGLATAAFLRAAGVEPSVFGDPLSFWRDNMPAGMLLRSSKRASNIASPDGKLTLDRWAAEHGTTVETPVPLSDFLAYGEWFADRVAPDLDRRAVRTVESNGGLRVTLEDGEQLEPERVVVAAGIAPFPRIPPAFASFPPELVSHSSAHVDLGRFAGRRVAVLGGGQSALESAALLHEGGAEVVVLARTDAIWWLAGPAPSRMHWPTAPTDVGGPMTSWLAAAPDVFRRLPTEQQRDFAFRCIRPAGAHWLRDRLADVEILTSRSLTSASAPDDGGLTLTLSDDSTRSVDHLLLATGYEIDVRRYPFLGPTLRARLAVSGGYPVLGPGLESSSVPGLHFVGAPAAHSFGPVMRFVTGSWYCAPAVAERIRGRRQRPVRWAFSPIGGGRRVIASHPARA